MICNERFSKTDEKWKKLLLDIQSSVLAEYTGDDREVIIESCFEPEAVRERLLLGDMGLIHYFLGDNRLHKAPVIGNIASSVLSLGIEEISKLSLKTSESFSERLLRMIDERNLKDPDVYNKANITRQSFSKIRNGKSIPTKKTIFAMSLAMRLNLDETEDLLRSAGFAIADNNVIDLAVKYFVEHGMYDMAENEQILYECFGETLTGKS